MKLGEYQKLKVIKKGFQGPHHCDDQPAETDAWRTGGA